MSNEHEPGCCVDRRFKEGHPDAKVEGCNAHTCMRLPAGRTCGDCFAFSRCQAILSVKPSSTICDFFPRRFGLPVTSSIDSEDADALFTQEGHHVDQA